MARPNTQTQRRKEILDAAITLIEKCDLATLHLADIAKEMGLTTNAIRYYFKSMEELLSALALRSDVRFYDDRLAVVERTPDVRKQLALTIAAGLPYDAEDAEWRAIWRAVLTAGFELHERHDVQGIFHRQVDLYAQILTRGSDVGVFTLATSARDVAITLMSMEDYLGYRIVARDPLIDRATGLRMMKSYAQLATGVKLPRIT